MTRSSGNGRWALQAFGGVGVSLLIAAACAGGDTPQRTTSLEGDIIARYSPEDAVGVAGSASMAGSGGGSSAAGQGGSASATAGSGGGGGSSSTPVGGGAGSGSTVASGDYCNAPVDVLKPACGFGSGCHGADSRLGDFGDSESAARALIDVETVNGCGSYIDSANPEDSQILVKIAGDVPGGCGTPMPFMNDPLPDSEVDCVRDWLSQF